VDERVATNQRRWEEMTDLHVGTYAVHERDSLGHFPLKPIEAAELGPISGGRVCHLQCHIGDNSFSLAQLGASEVVGVDFSSRSIEVATMRAARLGLSDRVRFVHVSVNEAAAALGSTFDGVYTSWGALTWLPDIASWAATVHGLLKSQGWFYVADTHPYAMAVRWPSFPYGGATAVYSDSQGDYTDPDAKFEHPESWSWNHGLGEIVTALIDAGMTIQWLHEHQVVAWHLSDLGRVVQRPDGMWEEPGSTLPLAFSLRAVKSPGV
jgi:SAM-dependent methyltransferase